MRLEKISPLNSDGSSFALSFDDGSSLHCGSEEVLSFALSSGAELDEEEYLRLKAACEYYLVRRRAVQLLSRKPMSAGELQKKLREKGAGEDDARRACERLKELGILNEAEYARAVVRHYSAKGYGRSRVISELIRHMVPAEYREEALEEMPESGEMIDGIVKKALFGKEADEREKRRLYGALARRGYSWDEINAALRRYEESAEDNI